MKRSLLLRFSPFLALNLFLLVKLNAQNTFPSTGSAGIGTTSPNASSVLEMKSTTKGVLVPRMTLTQRNAIASPATGLLIYQTNSTPGFYYYSGSAWTAVSATAGANGIYPILLHQLLLTQSCFRTVQIRGISAVQH